MTYSVDWIDNHVRMLDQRLLPHEERYLDLTTSEEVAEAIRNMTVRGAPAIGVAAAYGVVLAAKSAPRAQRETAVVRALDMLARTRPTAVNLFTALKRMERVLRESSTEGLLNTLTREARSIHNEEIDASQRISAAGASLIPHGATVLTHCNAGMIATAAHGTAVGAILEAHRQGKIKRTIATETRPLLQGARLTVWELVRADVPTTLICDSMVGHLMRTGQVDCVVVGADRIAANGDVANKVGTYSIAVLARAHRVPFYVAAPTSTVDMSLRSGNAIEIEQRSATEITEIAAQRLAADGAQVYNPAFDVTPHRLITAIVTERGILMAPFKRGLRMLAGNHGGRRT